MVGTGNSPEFGVEYAYWLLFTTHTTGRRRMPDTFSDSCHRPLEVAPSPQIASATRGSPRIWYASAAPAATGYAFGRFDSTVNVFDPDQSPMWLLPSRPRVYPSIRPQNCAMTRLRSRPLVSWADRSRCVGNSESSGRSA